MTEEKDVLFVPYRDTLRLLSVDDALKVCEQVYQMHARGSVVLSRPPSFKLDEGDGFNNHWHVKSVFLKEVPATGVRVYNSYDDGVRNTVGGLDCTRYIALSSPSGGQPLAIVDEHWSYAIRGSDRCPEMGGTVFRDRLYAEIDDLACGKKKGHERDDERLLIHTTGLVSQDATLAHFIYQRAVTKGSGIWLPMANKPMQEAEIKKHASTREFQGSAPSSF